MDADKNVGTISAKRSAAIIRAAIARTVWIYFISIRLFGSVFFVAVPSISLLKKTRPQEKKVLSLNDDVDTERQRDERQQQHGTDRQTLQSKEQQLKQALMRNKQLQQTLMNKEQQLQRVTRDKERLKTEYRRVREANKVYSTCVGSMKKKSVHLINQRDADRREIEGLKEQIASLSTDITCLYDMRCSPSGVAVIINNIHFEDMADRDGAEGDTDRLKEVFESLGFTVVTFSDLDHAKMVTTMKDQGKADHSNYDCFVCVIMSHGTMGKVYSSDDVGIDICELMKPVNAKKCPSLKGKPKLFFIQACQGEKTQRKEGFDHGEYDAKPVPFICHEADFFLGLATVPGYVARRDQDGAPYVHHLAKLLKDFGPTHDLSAIMAMVCDKMNDIHDDKFGWISSNHSTLRKKVVFNTK